MHEPARALVIATSNRSPASIHQLGQPRLHEHRPVQFRETLPRPILGLAARLCTARRAIKTSYQQSDHWILIDTRFYIGQGNWALRGRGQRRRKEPSTDLNESKTTIKQRKES